ncbi:hypothetical protein PsWM33_04289 [Pseudovibrio sp. WM33]|nr:hypothetical protein PsWM33_04289 [Pseudovibrio sp. WM33]
MIGDAHLYDGCLGLFCTLALAVRVEGAEVLLPGSLFASSSGSLVCLHLSLLLSECGAVRRGSFLVSFCGFGGGPD